MWDYLYKIVLAIFAPGELVEKIYLDCKDELLKLKEEMIDSQKKRNEELWNEYTALHDKYMKFLDEYQDLYDRHIKTLKDIKVEVKTKDRKIMLLENKVKRYYKIKKTK